MHEVQIASFLILLLVALGFAFKYYSEREERRRLGNILKQHGIDPYKIALPQSQFLENGPPRDIAKELFEKTRP